MKSFTNKSATTLASIFLFSAFHASAEWRDSNFSMTDAPSKSELCDIMIPQPYLEGKCNKDIKIDVLNSYFESKNQVETLRRIQISLPGSVCRITIAKNLGDPGHVHMEQTDYAHPGEIIGQTEPSWNKPMVFLYNDLKQVPAASANFFNEAYCVHEHQGQILAAKIGHENVSLIKSKDDLKDHPEIPEAIGNSILYQKDWWGFIIYKDKEKKEVIGYYGVGAGLYRYFTVAGFPLSGS